MSSCRPTPKKQRDRKAIDEAMKRFLKEGRSVRKIKKTPQYNKYMISPEWKEKRQEACEVLGTSCELCYSDEKVYVHHNNYEYLGNEIPKEDLAVLCQRCHSRFHKSTKPREMKRERGKMPWIRDGRLYWQMKKRHKETCRLCGRFCIENYKIREAPQRKIHICSTCISKYSDNILREKKKIIKTMEAR